MNLTVKTQYGEVRGFEDDGLNKWFGIPFAAPPVGELRFKRTHPCTPWEDVKETTKFSPAPYQFMAAMNKKAPEPEQSEDCLYLNVWAPKNAEKCPVFVWIYGGANASGMANDPAYDGTSFAKNGVVYVTFNYRVGPLGFYNFSIYDDSFDSNCGVADQIEALRWVKNNIAAFGGDPDNITIAGESAGASGVYDMLAAPSAKGLFKKAIAQSGLASGAFQQPRTTKLNVDLYLNQLGVKPKEINKLRRMSPEELKPAALWLMAENNRVYPGIFVPGPVQDDLLPVSPWEAMERGDAADIDVIFGTNHDEGTLFIMTKMFPINWGEIETMLKNNGCEDKLPEFKRLYAEKKERDSAAAVARDRAFWADYVRCADAQSKHAKVYAYRFDFATTILKFTGLGAMHSSEISHVLNTFGPMTKTFSKLTSKKRIAALREKTHNAWLNFCKTGDPNGSHLPFAWETYDAKKRTTYIFNDTCSVETDPNKEYYELWKDISLYQ